MTELNLFQKGQQALNSGSGIEAVRKFVQLEAQQFDLLYSLRLPGEISRIQLMDVDFDGRLELGALTARGDLSIYTLGSHPETLTTFTGLSCRGFRFFPRGRQEPALVALQENNTLSVHTFRDNGGRSLTTVYECDLTLPSDAEEILDITYKPFMLYVTTSQGNIYEYSAGALHQPPRVCQAGEAVTRLKSGGRVAHADNAQMRSHLLGILRCGGLMLFDVGLAGLSPGRRIHSEKVYVDAFIGDPDNDGIDDIIAITQEGSLHIFDWHSLELRHRIRFPDEFHALYCQDIDGDGVLEMLVGARGNRIYSFAIKDGKLGLKREYATGHDVRDLWVGNVLEQTGGGGEDVRAIAGLVNGDLEVFQVRSPREINRSVSDAFRNFVKHTPEDRQMVLLDPCEPLCVARAGLERLAPRMTCPGIIDALKKIESRGQYRADQLVLSQLSWCFGQFQDNQELSEYASDFLMRTFDRYLDLPARERVCAALGEIIQTGAGHLDNLRTQYEYFNSVRIRQQDLWLEGVRFVEALIGQWKLREAADQLKLLRLQGVDTLRKWSDPDGITSLSSHDDRIVIVTRTRWLKALDAGLKEQVFSRRYPEGLPRCSRTGHPDYPYLIHYDRTVEVNDSAFRVLKSSRHPREIVCSSAAAEGEDLYLAVAQVDGTVVLESLAGETASYSIPTRPAGIVLRKGKESLDLWTICVDCTIHCVRDATGRLRRGARLPVDKNVTPPSVRLKESRSVLDWAPFDTDDGASGFVVLSPSGLCVAMQGEGQPMVNSWFCLDKPPTCLAIHRNADTGDVEAIVGTRERSLLFISLSGKIRKEVCLPDVPIVAWIIAGGCHDGEIVIAFAQGTMRCYQPLSQKTLRRLEERCDSQREDQRRKSWQEHDLGEKLALIALGRSGYLDAEEIHGALDPRIRGLVRSSVLARAVVSPKLQSLLKAEVQETRVRYTIRDAEYSKWISRQDPFSTIHEHREELVDSVRLADVCRIDSELADRDQKKWLFELLHADADKWKRLLEMAGQIDRRHQDAGDDISLRRSQLEDICKTVGALFGRVPPVERDLSPQLSAFEIQMPGIKFRGFDRILAVIPSARLSIDGRGVEWIKSRPNVAIALVLVCRDKQLIRDALKGSAFSIAVLDEEDIKELLLADAPREMFLDRLVRQINIEALSPFQTRGPVVEMFYGRSKERQAILEAIRRPDIRKNYAIIGPRRIGKTSLLCQAKQDIDLTDTFVTCFLDLGQYGSPEECFGAIRRELEIPDGPSDDFVAQIKAFCRESRRPLALFLDEVDAVLKADLQSGEVFTTALRRLMNEGKGQERIKVVTAGYAQMFRQMRTRGSPMFNGPEALELSALERQDAYDLVADPFKGIYQIRDEEINEIIDRTGCYPNFIQLCCSMLVRNRRLAGSREITRREINQVLSSRELYEDMVNTYLLNLSDRCRIILYLLVSRYDKASGKIITDPAAYDLAAKSARPAADRKHEPVSFERYDVHRLLEVHRVNLTEQQLETLMGDLVLASVIRKEQQSSKYFFVLPDLPRMLTGQADILLGAVNLLENMEETFEEPD